MDLPSRGDSLESSSSLPENRVGGLSDESVRGGGEESRGGVGRTLSGLRMVLESRRLSSWVVDTGLFVVERNRRVPGSLFAGALASRFLIFAVPFIVLTVVATGFYADIVGASAVDIAQDAGMPGLLADAAGDSEAASDGFRAVTLVVMAFGTVWAADSLARLVRRIYALMWAVPPQRPRWRWSLPIAVLAVAVCGLLVSRIGLEVGDWPFGLVLVEALLELVFVTACWMLVTRFLPRDPAAYRWTHRLPGALVVASGIVGMRAAVVLYFAPHAVTLSDRYGDIAAAVLLLTWSYWVAFIIIYSAELDAALFRSHQRRYPQS